MAFDLLVFCSGIQGSNKLEADQCAFSLYRSLDELIMTQADLGSCLLVQRLSLFSPPHVSEILMQV